MKKIILIDHEPFTKRRKELFYDVFAEAGLPMEIWDVSQFVFAGIRLSDVIDGADYVCNIGTFDEFDTLLKRTDVSDTIFIVECLNNWHTRKIYRLLSDRGCYTVKIDFYGNTTLKESWADRMKRFCSPLFAGILKNRIQIFFLWCYRKIHCVKGVNLYLSSSSICDCTTNRINHPDFENYRFKKHVPICEGRYIVFCDNYFPYHADYKYFYGCRSMPAAEPYQITLKAFFDYLEHKYGIPVIIAAHPKAEYHGGEFGDRRIIKYKTDNLLLNASLVLLHASNSVSYAVLANKPTVFITTDGYDNQFRFKQRIRILASSLGKKVYNLDTDRFDTIECEKIQEEYRKKYIYTYLTSKETENKRNITILHKIFSVL